MVYLNLSVNNVNNVVEFYSSKLGIFDFQAERRLICNIGVDLIIDLVLQHTDEHREIFDKDTDTISSYWISRTNFDDSTPINIIKNLQEHSIKYEEVKNLGGHYLNLKAPSGNKLTVHVQYGVIQ